MAQFLTTAKVSSEIEEIITGARSKLVFICPYWQLPRIPFERLKDADRKKVEITIVYGKDGLKDDQKGLLSELSNLHLYYLENLHAKCYYNENLMVITSMNFYEFSEKNNREMGVLISRVEDKALFEAAFGEAQSILSSSKKVDLGKQSSTYRPIRETTKREQAQQHYGFCIRCGRKKDYDPEKPYCPECYSVWAEFKNPDYPEPCCHKCGKPADTSMLKPLCLPCFRSS